MRRTLFLLLHLLLAAAAAQAIPTRIDITKLAGGGIVLDGDLSDSGWARARRVETFVEYFRADNVAPPVHTTAFITYDAQYVYIGFDAEDPRPREIRAPFVDRDKVLADQDYVSVVLDTQNDRRAATVFRVNPRGIQTDSILDDATGNEDFAPDFFFESVAHETARGWTAEMRIPLSSLHYGGADPQTWGVLLLRNYPRDFRYVMANTTIPKNSNCYLCHASDLTGLTALPAGGHLTLAPYSTAQRDEHRASDLRSPVVTDPLESDVGLDLKWSPSATLTFDGTLNPDFSQIESDIPQISVNSRFALDYPEKRTFFLEGVDLLSTPLRAVYTRAITSPAWGARATGKAGTTAYTVLLAEDRGGGTMVLPGALSSELVTQDFRSRILIARARTSFGRSFGGLLLTTREIEGGGHNRVFGPDFQWKMNDTDQLRGQVLFSDTTNPRRLDLSSQFDGRSMRGAGAHAIYTRDVRRYDIWAEGDWTTPGFRADDGFVPQVGTRWTYTEIGAHVYPGRGFFSFLRPYTGVAEGQKTSGGQQTRSVLAPGVYFRGKGGSDGWIEYHVVHRERVGNRFISSPLLAWNLHAAPSRLIPDVSLRGSFGGQIDYSGARPGRGDSITLGAALRPTDHLEFRNDLQHQRLRLRSGEPMFTAVVERLKTTYTFNSRSLVRLIGQYSDLDQRDGRSGGFSTSALYGYKLNWQTVFFVGWGDERVLDDFDVYRRSNRSVFMKVAYAFQR